MPPDEKSGDWGEKSDPSGEKSENWGEKSGPMWLARCPKELPKIWFLHITLFTIHQRALPVTQEYWLNLVGQSPWGDRSGPMGWEIQALG